MGAGRVTSAGGRTRVAELIASLARDVPDFPKPGVQFKDLTPVFADRHGFAAVTDALADIASGADLVAGIDSRGFLVAAGVATRLGTGVLAIRKPGKLPPPVLAERYDLEYGSAVLEIPADGIDLAGRAVVVIDDVLATGGTAAATCQLLEGVGAEVDSVLLVIELAALDGRPVLAGRKVHPLQVC